MKINGVFQSFQGEGKSVGIPSVFLRLYGCNLRCSWCDTPETWNEEGTKYEHPKKHKKIDECHLQSIVEIAKKLNCYDVRNLVITGGEPLIQQKELIELMLILKKEGWRFEVETNGTLLPTNAFLDLIDQINCSPKLSNAGPDNPLYRRIVPEALERLTASPKTNFKFVIEGFKDMEEIFPIINRYQIDKSRVYIMPEGSTRQAQLTRRETIRAIAREYQVNYTDRLHILMYDDKRGV
ncbi:MAG: 7-carboxy-7-deazaguanine synthase QueE [bacterium]|nr:7-carboxy-7-deazaguanine synthase QueE [bacterium]